jgi:hypothetical protein
MIKKITVTVENNESVPRVIRVELNDASFAASCSCGRGIEWMAKWSRHTSIPETAGMTPEDYELVFKAVMYCVQRVNAQ